jgi:hypothetical protein
MCRRYCSGGGGGHTTTPRHTPRFERHSRVTGNSNEAPSEDSARVDGVRDATPKAKRYYHSPFTANANRSYPRGWTERERVRYRVNETCGGFGVPRHFELAEGSDAMLIRRNAKQRPCVSIVRNRTPTQRARRIIGVRRVSAPEDACAFPSHQPCGAQAHECQAASYLVTGELTYAEPPHPNSNG